MIMEAYFLHRKVAHHFPLLLFYDIDLEAFLCDFGDTCFV